MTTLVTWNPWQELNALQSQLDREVKVPAAELRVNEEAVYLRLELPGMEAKDLDIQVTEKAVSISAERKSASQNEKNSTFRSEFHYGKFHRVIPLPARVENTNVTADYKDGILNLTLPKTAAEKNKVVKVSLTDAV